MAESKLTQNVDRKYAWGVLILALIFCYWFYDAGIIDRDEPPRRGAPVAQAAAPKPAPAPKPAELATEPRFFEAVLLPRVADYGDFADATDGPMPSKRYKPVTVQLMACKRVEGKYRWFFRVANTSGKPWKGKVRIWLIAENGWAFYHEDYETDNPIAPGSGLVCPYFETSSGAHVFDGQNVTAYGWAVAA